MKTLFFFLAPLVLACIAFGVFFYFFNKNDGKGALQVTANPKSNVYLNGKLIGSTPLCKCEGKEMIQIGDYTLRLEPEDTSFASFEEKIHVAKSILTVIDRTFGKGALSDAHIITLSQLDNKKAVELVVISFPDDVRVYVDSNPSGSTPTLLKNITESDHEIRLAKDGYREKTIRVRTVSGYKLSVIAYLGVEENVLGQSTALIASPSAAAASASATPSVTTILILDTPTGFLRVRESNSLASSEIARISPGDSVEFLDEVDNWYKVKLKDGKVGWVSKQYAKKQ